MLFLFGLLISQLYSYFILPSKEGGKPTFQPTMYPIMWKGMVILAISNKKSIHIHHWIIYFLICIVCFFYNNVYTIFGFSFGLFIQGLFYKDSFTLLCKNPY